MFLVIKKFIDKDSNKEYSIDSIYRSNNEKRIQRLKELGYLGEELIIKEEPREGTSEEVQEEVIEKSNKKK